jgi:Bacterial SH3 domain/Peptidase inhibitor family I36
MFASKLIRIIAFAAVALVGTAVAAFAATDAYVSPLSANLRAGPGTGYAVIMSLPHNAHLTVNGCTPNPSAWCAVETDSSVEGFIAKSLLKDSLNGNLPFNFNIIIGPGGPSIIIDTPTEPDDVAEVCFYKGANYSGANFCVESGDYDDDIPGSFDDNIESILISGGLEIEVCTDTDFGGICKTYDSSHPSLPNSVKNDISSYEVY